MKDQSVPNRPLGRAELEELASRWVTGQSVDWRQLYASVPVRVSLPGYVFATKRYWYGSFESGEEPVKGDIVKAPSIDGARPKITLNHWLDSVSVLEPTTEVELLILEEHIAVVRMQDRPNRNMFTPAILRGLMASFAEIERTDSIKVAIVTGYENIFSMGGTREELLTLSDQVQTFADLEFIFKGFLQCRVPVIAAMQGHASGGGLVFGLYADLVIMAEEALYSAAFTKYGFTPGLGATFILSEKLGDALATEMMMTASTYRGSDLLRRGPNVLLRPQARVFDEALAQARALAEKPLHTLVTLKRTLAGRKLERLPNILEEELRMHAETFGHPEVKRRITQFIREPGTAHDQDSERTGEKPGMSSGSAPPRNGRVRLKELQLAAATEEITLSWPQNSERENPKLSLSSTNRPPDSLMPPASSFAEEVCAYLAKHLCETLHLEHPSGKSAIWSAPRCVDRL